MQQPRRETLASIPVIQLRPAPGAQALRGVPSHRWLFAASMAASLALAALFGIVLGVLAAARYGIGRDRWTEAVQAHADVQLWGWTAVFVVALAFEFVVRLNGRPPLPARPRAAALLLLAAGAVVAASGRVAGHFEAPLALAGSALILAGAGVSAALIARVPAMRPLSLDLQPLFFRAAVAWLALAAALGLLASARMQSGVVAAEDAEVVTEWFLRGFIANVVIAVGLRAFPGHLGIPHVEVRTQRLLWGALNAGIVLWTLGAGGFGLPGIDAARHTADLALAATLLYATATFRLHRVVRGWSRASERYAVMIPLAWLGLVVYALALAAQTVGAWTGGAPSLLEAGAVRHIYMLGFLAPLLIAMSHVVLERFGTGHILARDWLTGAFALLLVAWPLRALPPLLDPALGPAARGTMATAGLLTALALTLAAIVAVLNARDIAAHERLTARHPAAR